jgi:DNA processing protein
METLLPWFALKSVPGIGNILFKRLIDRFRSPAAVFEAPKKDLLQVEGITLRLISAIRRQQVPDWAKKDLDLAIRNNYQIITQSDASYPPLLHQIPDPPPLIYVYGRLIPQKLHVAMVGSRWATQYGLRAAFQLSRGLTSYDAVIVSGMARGIDTAAHKGAIASDGQTVAVLGSGLENIYPPENKNLFHRIAAQGAVISEFPLFADPEAHHFPMRNRLISGISHGTVVVEAGKKSGSLITARLAAEQNREVFAVPGNINSFRSIGSHALIKQGAKLVEKANDIIEEFGQYHCEPTNNEICANQIKPKETELTQAELNLLTILEPYPIHIDELVRTTGMGTGQLSSLLLQLEIKGLIIQTEGKYFQLLADNDA